MTVVSNWKVDEISDLDFFLSFFFICAAVIFFFNGKTLKYVLRYVKLATELG